MAAPSADGAAKDETQPYRVEWLLQKNADDDARGVWLTGDAQADAEFARNVQALLARADEQARKVAASSDSDVRMHVRCFAKRVVMGRSDRPSSFVPALAWSAEEPDRAASVATRVMRACEVRVTRDEAVGSRQSGAVMTPYSVELPMRAQSN